jgi:hypothetical protein
MYGVARANPGGLLLRIEDPDILNTHQEVVVNPSLNFREGIVRRKNLDTDVRRCRKHLLFRLW